MPTRRFLKLELSVLDIMLGVETFFGIRDGWPGMAKFYTRSQFCPPTSTCVHRMKKKQVLSLCLSVR